MMNIFKKSFNAAMAAWKERAYRHLVLCPWHEEKTASCIVDLQNEIVHCIGCGHMASRPEWTERMAVVCREHEIEPLFLKTLNAADALTTQFEAELARRAAAVPKH